MFIVEIYIYIYIFFKWELENLIFVNLFYWALF